jgi:hypothetical protein
MSHDLFHVGVSSINPFVQQLFQTSLGEVDLVPANQIVSKRQGNPTNSKKTLGNQFKIQLNLLLETITKTEPHFIRCLKSNMLKVPQIFETKVIINQLRYSGLLEVCKIRQCGYPVRYLFKTFLRKYSILCPDSFPIFAEASELAHYLEGKGYYSSRDFFVGHSKIFFKYETGLRLEHSRNILTSHKALVIQKSIRKFLAIRRVFHLKNTLINLKKGVKTRDYELLTESLAVSEHFQFFTAVNRPLMNEAKTLLSRLKVERDIEITLENSLKTNDLSILESAVNRAKLIAPPYSSTTIDDCLNKMQEIKAQIELARKKEEEKTDSPLDSPTQTTIETADILSNGSESPKAEREKNFLSPTQILPKSRNTVFLPLAYQTLYPFESINISTSPSRHSIVLAGSLLTHSRKIAMTESIIEEQRGRCLTKAKSIILSETRSLSPPRSPRITVDDIPIRSFSPIPSLHPAAESPPPLPKVARTSMLTRQVSTADINDMESIHEIISSLVAACSSEEGITVDDIDPIEQILQQLQYTGSALAKYASELMMAREELARARKQLQLQSAFDALTDRTPLWKIRNLVQQAQKLGMDNYKGDLSL